MWWYRALHRRLVAALADLDGCVLDAGCGTGGLLARLLVERPDLRAVGLEWAESASRRAAAKSGAPIVRGSVECAAVRRCMLRRRNRRRPAVPRRGRSSAGAGRTAAGPAAGRPADRQHAGLFMAAVRSRSPRAQRPTLHRGPAPRIAPRCRLRPRAMPPTGMVCCCRSWWRSASFWRRNAAASDVAPFPPWLDAMFHAITEIERRLPFCLPAGGSVLATAERP